MLPLAAVTVSVGGLILGVFLGALVYFVVRWLLSQHPATAQAAPIVAAILAVLVFLVLGFDVSGHEQIE